MGQTFEDKTYGANLISAFLGCVWLGLAWAIGGVSFLRFRQDRKFLQVVAGLMLVLATMDSAAIIAQEYDSLINHYGDVYFTLETHWATGTIFGLIGGSALLLQSFFVYRIAVVSQAGSRWWRVYAAAMWLLSATSAVLNWYIGVWINQRKSALDVVQLANVVYASYACAITGEAMGTIALVWFLILEPRRQNRALGIADNSLFVRLVRKAVETNMLTLIFHIAGIALVQEAGAIGFWYAVSGQALTKVFAISLFANLLSRSTDQEGFSRQQTTQHTTATSEQRLNWPTMERRPSAWTEGGLSLPTSALTVESRRRGSVVKFGGQLTPDWERKAVIGYDSPRCEGGEEEMERIEGVSVVLRGDEIV